MVSRFYGLHRFYAAKDGQVLYSQQKQDRELTGSDHELLIAKFRLKLKKVGKTTRSFMYDLNQIPYDQRKSMKINEVDYSKDHRKKQDNFRQTCTSALLTTSKPLTVRITANSGKL